jgi:hypothetical protein
VRHGSIGASGAGVIEAEKIASDVPVENPHLTVRGSAKENVVCLVTGFFDGCDIKGKAAVLAES